jgi:phospholipid/cholesterol/gamma-HCH transport system ATP-binding protein
MNTLIQVRDLNTEFDTQEILREVSLDVYENEIVVILGKSGCGKTTLLKHIIGLYQPISGSIKIFGNEIIGIDEVEFVPIKERLGVLFQSGALLNSLTVFENIAIPLDEHTNLPKSVIERLIRTKLHLVELDGAIYKFPRQLSGGMRKRAALARSITLDPEILFCDEPTTGLDPVTSASIDKLIKKLQTQLKMTIIVITHELTTIRRIADRVIFMDEGRVLFTGTLQEAQSSSIAQIKRFFEEGRF